MANDVQQRQLSREEQEERRIAARREAIAAAIQRAADKIARLAGVGSDHIDGGALASQWTLASRKVWSLVDCSEASIIQAIATATATGLRFDGSNGHGYLVPFKGECTFIPGFRGLIDLAIASGAAQSIHVDVVCERDDFEYEDGTSPVVRHRRAWRDRGEPVCVWAVAHHAEGTPTQTAMGWDEVMAVKAKSPASRKPGSPWGGTPEDVIEMAKKTAIRRLIKLLPVNPDRERARQLALALDADDAPATIIDADVAEPAPASRTAALADDLASMTQPPQLPESTGGEPADLTPAPEQARVPASRPQSQAAMEWGKK